MTFSDKWMKEILSKTVIRSSSLGLRFWIPQFESKWRFTCPYIKSLLLPIPVWLLWVMDGQGEKPWKYCGGGWCQATVPCLPRGKKPTVCILYFWEFVLSSYFLGRILAVCLLFHWLLVGAAAPWRKMTALQSVEPALPCQKCCLAKWFWVCRTNLVFFTRMLHSH